MKKVKIVFVIMLIAVSLNSCKTTEANYKKAYEAAKEKQMDTDDSTVTQSLKNSTLPKLMILQGIELPVRTEVIGLTKDGGATKENLKVYNVAVASFKQLFNAKSMCERLREHNYNAFLLHNRDLTYYVIAGTTDKAIDAKECIDKIKADRDLVLKSPFPYVLRAAHLVK